MVDVDRFPHYPSYYLDRGSKERPAESILVFAGDQCGPGAFNYPLYSVFCDPMHNGGLLLNPKLHKGFTLTIIDVDRRERDRLIRLDVPEGVWDEAVLLQNPDRFAIEAIHSRHKPDEQTVAVRATRLHNVAGKYTGKDDPVAVVRTQGVSPVEVASPLLTASVGILPSKSLGNHPMSERNPSDKKSNLPGSQGGCIWVPEWSHRPKTIIHYECAVYLKRVAGKSSKA